MKAVIRSRSSEDAPAAPTLDARYYQISDSSYTARKIYLKDLPSLIDVFRDPSQER
jgi:hypothetical protein